MLEFDEIYNAHCELKLDSGRSITLDTFVQNRTYAGLQVGHPNKESNDMTIEWHLEYARKLPNTVGDPFLIFPTRRDYRVSADDMQHVIDRQADHPPDMMHIPEWMPEIYTVATFHSIVPTRNSDKDWSALTVLWYQPDFGLDSHAMKPIRSVDWDHLATDLEW